MFLSPSQTPRFHFIIGSPPPVPSDFCFIMKKSLYKRFYTKIPNSATFDVKNGHYTVFLTNYFFRLAIPLYFLSLYNGGIDAQNTHFQSNKSQNELHFLKYSSIFSFWAKIKRPSVLQPTVKQVYGTEKFIFSIRNDIIILFAL